MRHEIHDPGGRRSGRGPRADTGQAAADPRVRAHVCALWAARRGWHVFPLFPDHKAPAVKNWEHAGSTDPAAIGRWPSDTTGYGIACGPSGLYVIDCDVPKLDTPPPPAAVADATWGLDVLVLLCAEAGHRLGRTFTVHSGRGGMHLYYQMPEPELRNTAGRLGWLIDTRGRGGYIVGPGSTVAGLAYRTADSTPPCPLPAWLVSRLTGGARDGIAASRGPLDGPRPVATGGTGAQVSRQWAAAALRGEAENIRTAPNGQGNQAVNDAAFAIGQLVGANLIEGGLAVHELMAALDTWSWEQPHDRARMVRTLHSALAAGVAHPRVVSPRELRRTTP